MKSPFRISILAFALLLAACHKPEPHPETLDPIFSELEKEKKALEAQVQAEEKQHEEFLAALKEVKPQTGQNKYANKRLYESEARLTKLKQYSKFLELRSEARLAFVQKDYLDAFNKDKPWPDPKEFETYKSQKNLELAPRTWSAKDRIERFAAPAKKPASAEHE